MIFLALIVVLAGIGMTIAGWRAHTLPAPVAPSARREFRGLLYLAPLGAGLATLYFLLVPTYQSIPGGRRMMLEVNGPGVLLPLLAPVLLASLPAFLWHKHGSAVVAAGVGTVLAVFCMLAGFSIGMFYLPSAALLITAAFSALRQQY